MCRHVLVARHGHLRELEKGMWLVRQVRSRSPRSPVILLPVTDHDHHSAANTEQVRLLREELEQRTGSAPLQEERPPEWIVPFAATVLGFGLLAGWWLWQDPGLTLGSGLMVLAIVLGLTWGVWGR